MTPLPALAAALALGIPAQPSPTVMLHVALCDGGSAKIPIERQRRHERDCAPACHAVLCGSRKRPGSV